MRTGSCHRLTECGMISFPKSWWEFGSLMSASSSLRSGLPVKYVDAHRCEITLRLSRLFFKFVQCCPSSSVFMIPKRLASFSRNRDHGDGSICLVLLVECKHLVHNSFCKCGRRRESEDTPEPNLSIKSMFWEIASAVPR